MSIENIKMLYYYRIGVSEGIDVNKTRASKECDVSHFWYFLNCSFNDLLMMSVNLSDFAILNIIAVFLA